MGHIWTKKSDLGHFSLQCELSLVSITESLSIYRLFSERFTEWVGFKSQSHVRVWSCFVNIFALKSKKKKIRVIIKTCSVCLPFFWGKTVLHTDKTTFGCLNVFPPAYTLSFWCNFFIFLSHLHRTFFFQCYLTTIRTYFTKWLIRTNS